MKNLIKISLSMMLTLFLFASCSKNDDETPEPDQKAKAITQQEMQNKANPYDEQGAMFTGFLKVMANDGDLGGWDVSQIAAFNGDLGGWDVSQIAAKDGGPDGWDVGQVIDLALKFNSKDDGDKASPIILHMQLEAISGMGNFNPIDDCLWRPDRCKKFQSAIQALDSSNDGTAYDHTLKFINTIRKQEAEIQDDDEMKDLEKKDFLISYAIARHAAGYWYNAIIGDDQPFPWDKHHVGFLKKIISINTQGASAAFMGTENEEAGVSTAILSAYIAKGGAK